MKLTIFVILKKVNGEISYAMNRMGRPSITSNEISAEALCAMHSRESKCETCFVRYEIPENAMLVEYGGINTMWNQADMHFSNN